MAGDSTADLDANFGGRQFELILKHDDLAGAELEEVRSLLNRAAGLVHESCRPKQDDPFVVEDAFRSLALKTAAPRCETMTPRNFIDGHEADVVPVICVFRTGIAEANKESHDAASRAQLLLLVAATGRRLGAGRGRLRTGSRGSASRRSS